MLKIGQYQLNSNVFLAPMAGVSDAPFRQICRQMGAGLTTSEMVIIKPSLLNSSKSKYRLDFKTELSPVSVQIAGSDPKQLAYAAQYAADLGAQIIDINMGCPAKKVCNKAAGSALMQDEMLVADILSSVVNALPSDIPTTLKTRTGWDRENKNVLNIANIAQNEGIKAMTIHGRTRADKYNGEAEYDTIAQVVNQVSIPVIVNGDITSANKAQTVLDKTCASAVMIGRGVQGNPWLLQEINHTLNQTFNFSKPSKVDKSALILQHIQATYNFYGEKVGVRLARKHIFWYASHLSTNYRTFWTRVNKITDPNIQYQLTQEFLNQWIYKQI